MGFRRIGGWWDTDDSLKGSGKVGQIFKPAGIGGRGNAHTLFHQTFGLGAAENIDKADNGIAGQLFKLPGQIEFTDSDMIGNVIQGKLFGKICPNVGDGFFDIYAGKISRISCPWTAVLPAQPAKNPKGGIAVVCNGTGVTAVKGVVDVGNFLHPLQNNTITDHIMKNQLLCTDAVFYAKGAAHDKAAVCHTGAAANGMQKIGIDHYNVVFRKIIDLPATANVPLALKAA